jgi:hypothetical protein
VGLGFSLKSADHLIGVDFQNAADLVRRLDSTPPSLYLFEPEMAPHANEANSFIYELEPGIVGATAQLARCYYIEFRRPQCDEYNRSVFLEG